jgi:hypothetical protein
MNYPKYLSHKEVSAAKIAAVDQGADGSITVHLEGGFDSVTISHHDRKHKPAPEKGWYLVQYSDGYISFSPAAAFEEGYALAPSERISGSPQHLVDAQKAREAAGDGSVEQLADAVQQSAVDEEEDDEEDEEVLDAANNHGQNAPAQSETVAG